MENKSWHRLDNSGKIYPFNLKNNIQNLFRISAVMKEDVNPDVLTDALQSAIRRYPFFNVCLRRGVFWHYLEELDGRPEVTADSDLLIKDIDTIRTYGFNFRVSYYGRKISIDCFHALCDGNGCMEFFKTILFEYLRLSGHTIDGQERVLLPNSPVLAEESEDGFLKYAKKVKLKDLKGVDELRGKKAFNFTDFRFDYKGTGVVQGTVDTAKLLELSRKHNSTVTAFVGGALIYAICKAKISKPDGNLPVVLFIPINLRKQFPSRTLLNFSLFSRVSVDVNGNPPLSQIVERVAESIKKDTRKQVLQDKINVTAKTEKLWIFRIMPLPVKQFIYRLSGFFFGNGKKTMTFSNMGVIALPDPMKDYIDEISIMASTSSRASSAAMTTVSALGKTTMTFARKIVDTEVEKEFFRLLADEGLDVTVKSNYWEV